MRHPPRTDIQELPQCRWIVAKWDEEAGVWLGYHGGSKKEPPLKLVSAPTLKALAELGVPVHRTRPSAQGRAWRLEQSGVDWQQD